MKKEILAHLMGPGEPAFFIAAVIFALVGVLISLLVDSNKRDVSNPRTPDDFKLGFLICDNGRRILLNLLLILVTLRFSTELIGSVLTMWGALLVGLGWDRLSSHLRSKGLFEKKIPDRPAGE